MPGSEPILGIDLGTTNSLVGLFQDGVPTLIPNALGSMLTPSAVSLDETGHVLIGLPARERLLSHPEHSAAAFKRAMGTSHVFRLGSRRFRAEELSALVLRSLADDVARARGQPIRQAVITVPAYFSDAQRKATRTAGQLAGLEVVRLLNEPTAAALAYGLHEVAEQRIMVLDLGGGTFDVSILELFEGVMEVRASAGDNRLGGEDFVAAIAETFLAERGPAAGIPPTQHRAQVHATLHRAAEIAKRALTEAPSTELVLAYKGQEWRWPLTRERFEQIASPLLLRMRAPIERALRDAKLRPSEIGRLVLAGGATRMPMVRRLAARLFEQLPIASVSPDEVVAFGAAVQAGLVARDAALEDRVMTDVAPFTMGIETVESRDGQIVARDLYTPIIERNTAIPASRSMTVRTVIDGQRMIKLRVFQGEARLVKENIPLGALSVPVPSKLAGEEAVEVRFTYDTSGLLEVEARAVSTGALHRLVVEQGAGGLAPDEVRTRLANLAALKVHPRDAAENLAVLARAERLYEERIGTERADIGHRIDRFRILLDGQDPAEIALARQDFAAWLDLVDTSVFD